MESHVTGQAAVAAAVPQSPVAQADGLKTLILELVLGSTFAAQEEISRCITRVTNCHNAATLAKWYRNAVRELANREEAATTVYATGQQKEEVIRLLNNPLITRRHKSRVLLGINSLKAAEARDLIASLTAYITAPFGGGAVGAFAVGVSCSSAA